MSTASIKREHRKRCTRVVNKGTSEHPRMVRESLRPLRAFARDVAQSAMDPFDSREAQAWLERKGIS